MSPHSSANEEAELDVTGAGIGELLRGRLLRERAAKLLESDGSVSDSDSLELKSGSLNLKGEDPNVTERAPVFEHRLPVVASAVFCVNVEVDTCPAEGTAAFCSGECLEGDGKSDLAGSGDGVKGVEADFGASLLEFDGQCASAAVF